MKAARGAVAPATALVIVFIDQAAKVAVRRELVFGESLRVIPGFFSLSHIRNTGAVWGIFQQQNTWLVLLSLLILALLAFFHRRLTYDRLSLYFGIGCIVGGITGNLIDRIRLGWVTDFLDFYWNGAHWPCFNIADSAICVGVFLYLFSSLLLSSRSAQSSQTG